VIGVVFIVAGCVTGGKPKNIDNVCAIFNDKPHWYRAAKKSSERWGGPIHIPMSIMYQESSFRAKAKPKMQYFLWVIPTGRPSNAYGYAQALKSTWKDYEGAVGSRSPDRDDFRDAIDFVFWYMNRSSQRNKVSKWDAYSQYLNYHEGQGGYARGTHLNKQWLLNTANRVDARAKRYAIQLDGCRAKLDKKKRRWF